MKSSFSDYVKTTAGPFLFNRIRGINLLFFDGAREYLTK